MRSLLYAAATVGTVVIVLAGPAPASAAPDTTPPPTPLSLLVNNVTDTRVSMQWTPGYLTEPTGWRVFRNGVQVGQGASSAFTDRNLVPGGTYSYHVVAYDAAGNTSAPTRTVTVTTRGPGVSPGAPANLRLTAVDPARLTLAFDRPGDEFDVSRYVVLDGATVVASGFKWPYGGASTSVDVRTLAPGSTHSYTVRAERPGYGRSAPTNTVTVTLPTTTDAQPPSAPAGLVATESRYACDFADLRWTQSTDNVDAPAAIDYEVFTDGAFNHVVRGTGVTLSIQFSSQGTHTVAVRAVDGSGNASAVATTTYVIGPWCPLES
jgi:chitodextrinase